MHTSHIAVPGFQSWSCSCPCVLWEGSDNGSTMCPCHTHGRCAWSSSLLAWNWPNPGYYGHLGSETVHGSILAPSQKSIFNFFKNKDNNATLQTHFEKQIIWNLQSTIKKKYYYREMFLETHLHVNSLHFANLCPENICFFHRPWGQGFSNLLPILTSIFKSRD